MSDFDSMTRREDFHKELGIRARKITADTGGPYVVCQPRRGNMAHVVEPWNGRAETYQRRFKYILGPFKKKAAADRFALFADKAEPALMQLAQVARLAEMGKLDIGDEEPMVPDEILDSII
jgi:hypothetical protein